MNDGTAFVLFVNKEEMIERRWKEDCGSGVIMSSGSRVVGRTVSTAISSLQVLRWSC